MISREEARKKYEEMEDLRRQTGKYKPSDIPTPQPNPYGKRIKPKPTLDQIDSSSY
jgi:hypothetical protein